MNDSAPSLSKLQHEKSLRKPYAGNLQVRFDEEEGAARPPLLTLLPLCFQYLCSNPLDGEGTHEDLGCPWDRIRPKIRF